MASRSAYGCGMNFRPFRLALVALSLLGSGPLPAAEKRYAVQDFDRVQVFGPFSVAIQTGRATSVTAMGDQQALDAVSVVSSGGVLTVQTIAKARSAWKDEPHAAARLVVIMPQLKGVRLLGTGKIAATEMRGISNDISLSGGGQINVAKLSSDTATIYLSGSGRIVLAGMAKNVNVNVSGSGDLDATQLSASDLKIVSATSGRVTAKALRTADIKQNGAGEIDIAGHPSCIVENPGTGTTRCGN